MTLSVIPSERYSVFGSELVFANGITAIESIATSVGRLRRYMPSPTAPRTNTMTTIVAVSLCCLIPETMYSALDEATGRVAPDETGTALPDEPRVEPIALGGTVVSLPALPA